MSRAMELAALHLRDGCDDKDDWNNVTNAELEALYAAARADGLREAADLLPESVSSLRLHMGEMKAQEVRSIQAYIAWKCTNILAKLEPSK